MMKSGLIRKIHFQSSQEGRFRLISKFLSLQPGQQTNAIHVFNHISRSKYIQSMKSGQYIECDLRNFNLEKSQTKCGKETIPIPFSKTSKLSTSLDQ